MSQKILYADDDPRMRRLVKDFLEREGYVLLEADNGADAVIEFRKHSDIGMVLLDVMMPKLTGWDACKEIRKDSQVPIVMITAKGEEYDELFGFQIGADDYISKPFSPLVLVARINALLKRSEAALALEEKVIWEKKGIKVDFSSTKVFIDGELMDMSPKEYDLLECFIRNEGLLLTRDKLLNQVWGYDYFGDARTVDTHINRLRAKLGKYDDWVQTVRGKGYRFEVI